MRAARWLAGLAIGTVGVAGVSLPAAGYGATGPVNIDPASALPVSDLPFQESATYDTGDLAPATDPANEAVAQACTGGSELYLPQWFGYEATEDVNLLVRSAAVPRSQSGHPVVSPIAWVTADLATIACGITHAFDRQQIGPFFLSAGESVFVVRFVPTQADAQLFATEGHTLHTRIQATPGVWEGDLRNDSWWTPTAIPSDLPQQVSSDVGLASLGSVEVELAGATECWGSTSQPRPQPAVWYSYLTSSDQSVVVDTSGSDYPTAVVVALGSGAEPTDPACLTGSPAARSFVATAGTRYLIGVYGYDRANVNVAGTLRLSVRAGASPSPTAAAVVAPGAANGAPVESGPSTGTPSASPAHSVPASVGPAQGALPQVSVKARAARGRSILQVNVDPNRRTGRWTFQVQVKRSDGTWRPLRTYRTKGVTQTRTINLAKGTYRVWVAPRYGHQGALSAAVSLRR